ncbi:helix-turn-helix domain-containing protein [Methanoculleus bourgensis]|uniref:PAS domain-containing protein n=1 Tax=Methanoculleus bourgensis TaxID=83986 RepID=A0A0X8XZM9_9EURY|nr:helix-turn-helix domain-containing protein [Methanoculleus bourgensis]CVK34682.1 protein of unknown function [Methanoculleus bourgensis]
MPPEQEITGRILRTLRFRPKGMTITEIARALGMNRNSVSKHLEVMQVAGQVEARLVGNAKVYSVAQRVPLSAFLCFTQNLILVLDADLTIIQANDQLLRHFGRTKEELVGQNIRDTAIPAVSTPEALAVIVGLEREQVITDVCYRNDSDRESFYQMHAIPTTFEDGRRDARSCLRISPRGNGISGTRCSSPGPQWISSICRPWTISTSTSSTDSQSSSREHAPTSSPTTRSTGSLSSERSRARDSGRGSRNSLGGTPSACPSRLPGPSTPPITRPPM